MRNTDQFHREMTDHLLDADLTLLLTLALGNRMPLAESEFHLWKWARVVHLSLFRRSALRGVRTERMIRFLAFFERTDAGAPHYHLAAYVNAAYLGEFIEVAERRWRERFPSRKSFHQRPFDLNDGRVETIRYCLKEIPRTREALDGFTSSHLLLPPYCHRPKGLPDPAIFIGTGVGTDAASKVPLRTLGGTSA